MVEAEYATHRAAQQRRPARPSRRAAPHQARVGIQIRKQQFRIDKGGEVLLVKMWGLLGQPRTGIDVVSRPNIVPGKASAMKGEICGGSGLSIDCVPVWAWHWVSCPWCMLVQCSIEVPSCAATSTSCGADMPGHAHAAIANWANSRPTRAMMATAMRDWRDSFMAAIDSFIPACVSRSNLQVRLPFYARANDKYFDMDQKKARLERLRVRRAKSATRRQARPGSTPPRPLKKAGVNEFDR